VAVVGAILNMVWAAAGLVGPAAGGAVSETLGDQAAFFILTVIAIISAAWMWLRRDRGAIDPAAVDAAAAIPEHPPI
jgi:predicted MFS family arabinose efflux permease